MLLCSIIYVIFRAELRNNDKWVFVNDMAKHIIIHVQVQLKLMLGIDPYLRCLMNYDITRNYFYVK